MKIPKPTDDDKDYFRSLFDDVPSVEVKPMFGNLAAFTNDNMCVGLFGPLIGVRLPQEGREELLAEPGAGPFGPEERPMKEYVALPAEWRDEPASTERWIHRAIEHTATLPPKKEKAKK